MTHGQRGMKHGSLVGGGMMGFKWTWTVGEGCMVSELLSSLTSGMVWCGEWW